MRPARHPGHRLPLLLLAWLAAAPAAQEAVLDPFTGLVSASTELLLPPMDLEDGWLELTPLAAEAPASVVQLEDRGGEDAELRLRPDVPAGAAMLCTGARSYAVLCEQVFLAGEVWVEPGETSEVEVRFEPGLAVTGGFSLAERPVAGARVAAVPAGLVAARPFTMPLGRPEGDAAAPREVESDAEGRFTLPPLAEGEYFLEILLPSGRVHRGEPFLLPAPAAARGELGVDTAAAVSWDLGTVDVADGLVVELRVTDLEGLPLAGARVAGRQGNTPRTLVSYETAADGDGVAYLAGFSVEEPVRLACRRSGYRTFRHDYPLLPVFVACALEPLAALSGEVVGVDGLPVAGATVAVEPLAPDGEEDGGTRVQALGDARRFTLDDLPAGDYRLTAAAPGHEVAARTVTLEPGQRLELETILLLAGREVTGRVVDAETREPLAAVEIRATSPPGAVDAATGADGAFSFATRSDEPLVLRLRSPEHVTREVTLTPRATRSRDPLRFEMERGGFLRAVVWDEAADLPCQGCRLVLQPTSTELVTDGFGEVRSPPLRPGDYRVHLPRVTHLGSTVVSQGEAEHRLVRVRRGETRTVRFGERRRTVRVVFRPSPGPSWTLSARTPRRFEKVFPEAGGGYRVRHRAGESLALHLHVWDPSTGSEVEVRQAELPADLTADDVVLPLGDTSVHGRATSGGEALAAAPVRLVTLDDATWAATRTRADGTFSIPHVPAGVYAVWIGERNVKFASLAAGRSLDLGTFELIAGSY